MRRVDLIWFQSALVGLVACGAQSPPPQNPDSETSTSAFTRANRDVQAPADEIAVEGEADGETEEASAAENSGELSETPGVGSGTQDAPPEPEKAPGRPPSEILQAPRIAFMINYSSSAPSEAAEQKCAAEHGEDLKAKADCKREERKEFLADVVLFKKEGNAWWWYVYRRDRDTLFELSKSQVEFGEETDRTVQVKLAGKGSGQRPLFIGKREVTFTLPSESSLELDDPRYGKLVYEAKIGLVGN